MSDRYGGNYPDTATMCGGQCEGMGCIPVNEDETEPTLKYLWLVAQNIKPTEDGWHFVTCPDCRGTGKKGGTDANTQAP